MAALLIAIGFFATATSRFLDRSSRAILEENVSSLKAASELKLAIFDQRGLVASFLLEGDERWLRLLEEKRLSLERWHDKVHSVAFTEREREILRSIDSLYASFDREREEVIRLAREGRRDEARDLHLNRVLAKADRLYQACDELRACNEGLIEESRARVRSRVNSLQAGVWAGVAAAIIVGAWGGWVLSRALLRRLAEAERLGLLGRMAAIVAHEVRGPLTALRLRSQTLRKEALSLSGREDIAVIEGEINRLEGIVRSFLRVVRLPEPTLEPVRLSPLLSQAVALLQPVLGGKGLRVEQQVDESLPAVSGDPEQLSQVFLNLLLNASEAAPEGGRVTVSAKACEGARAPRKDWVEVRVSDDGPGVPESVRRRLFEPFFTTKASGTGLGLWLCRRVVARHGGAIRVDSSPGRGTTVIIRLPGEERSAEDGTHPGRR